MRHLGSFKSSKQMNQLAYAACEFVRSKFRMPHHSFMLDDLHEVHASSRNSFPSSQAFTQKKATRGSGPSWSQFFAEAREWRKSQQVDSILWCLTSALLEHLAWVIQSVPVTHDDSCCPTDRTLRMEVA